MYLKSLLMTEEIKSAVKKIDDQLKPFQAASVKYVLDQLYKKKRNKVLIADEVGLGKTIIAKGVIAKAVQKHKQQGKPFHVVYICSNQVLAYQNIGKLNPFGKSEETLSRLIFLAFNPKIQTNSPLRLSSLTPGTSFQLTRSVGYKEERAIIFKLLFKYADFQNSESSWKKLMKGNKQVGAVSWNRLIKQYKNDKTKLRPELARNFKNRLEQIPFSSETLPRTYGYLKSSYKSFYHALTALLRRLENDKSQKPLHFSYEIIKVLRKELTRECVGYLNADLFILDEFQRFKLLIDGDVQTEATEIARAVLHDDNAKVILLSATPFKPFTTHLDQLKGESHNDELKKVIEYLGGSKGRKLWGEFKKDQEAFFEILRRPKSIMLNGAEASEKRDSLENTFKKFISRNERISVASDYDDMTENSSSDKTDVAHDDIKNFIALDQLGDLLQAHKKSNRSNFGSLLEFSKSAPYPLSFLHGYNIKSYLDVFRNDPEIKAHLKNSKEAWLDYEKINNYKPVGFHKNEPNYPNGKFRVLANECFKNNGEFLLWVPPSKPKYALFGKYKGAQDFSKILLFSSWQMAPRSIASLLSYEVERRTIGADKSFDSSGKQSDLHYFDSPRRPGPLLKYSKSEKGKTVTYKTWMFNLTYPSKTLFENNELRKCVHSQSTYVELKREQVKTLEKLFIDLSISAKYENRNTPKDDSWYWISAPLLDCMADSEFRVSDIFRGASSKSSDSKGIREHRFHLENKIYELLQSGGKLGRMPDDLFRVLADITLASPANAAVLALHANYKSDSEGGFIKGVYNSAYIIAEAFVSLFNKPESISAVRNTMTKPKEHWKKVLRYCASGSISDMLEEYIYLLRDCNGIGSIDKIANELSDVLGVGTSSIDVEFNHKKDGYETHKMRCHFALNYGDQKMNTDSGANRMVNIRSIFNSPFRPFVLASTSVGQEGLDFHFYCRKIFHWNLPHNAIDLEQREGRINRYKGLVIRQKLTEILSDEAVYKSGNRSVWEAIFKLAKEQYSEDESGIKPYWYLDEGKSKLERFVPYHPFSKDHKKYNRLKSTLALYRLTFGQPRQEELIQALEGLNVTEEELTELRKTLLINLSPLGDYPS
jgi:hypothetical protein